MKNTFASGCGRESNSFRTITSNLSKNEHLTSFFLFVTLNYGCQQVGNSSFRNR